jgi:hypothetical protein
LASNWSTILPADQPAVLQMLMTHCHSTKVLLQNGYIVRPFTATDIACLRRCGNCRGKRCQL